MSGILLVGGVRSLSKNEPKMKLKNSIKMFLKSQKYSQFKFIGSYTMSLHHILNCCSYLWYKKRTRFIKNECKVYLQGQASLFTR